MMRKIVICILAYLMLCSAFGAHADDLGFMKVVNCEEWVSLREKPDAASECLVEVPLGALVENCSTKTKAFTYAEYDGLSGYIMTQYLEPVPREQMDLGDMYVADRGEWIAMRQSAEEEAAVVQWLAPGVGMKDCMDSLKGFAYCQNNGIKGYVRLSDLLPAAESMMQ